MTGPVRKLDNYPRPSFTIWYCALLITYAAAVAACNGGGSGDDNTNNTNDAGITSDAEVDAGPWTYDCPTDQPADHVCIRGQVRDFVTNEPVTVPEGALMTMFAARNKDDFPNEFEAEVDIQPDGRFIFPSVEQYLVQEFNPDTHPELAAARHYLFNLRLGGEIASYRIADNQYGLDYYDFEITYYILSDATLSAWEENWLWKAGEAPDEWILDVENSFKTVIGLCYGEALVPLPLVPQPYYCFLARPGEQQSINKANMQMDLDRLHFTNYGPDDCTGLGVAYVPNELLGDERLYMQFDLYGMSRPALGKVGPANVDHSGQLVVVHGAVIETPYE